MGQAAPTERIFATGLSVIENIHNSTGTFVPNYVCSRRCRNPTGLWDLDLVGCTDNVVQKIVLGTYVKVQLAGACFLLYPIFSHDTSL